MLPALAEWNLPQAINRRDIAGRRLGLWLMDRGVERIAACDAGSSCRVAAILTFEYAIFQRGFQPGGVYVEIENKLAVLETSAG